MSSICFDFWAFNIVPERRVDFWHWKYHSNYNSNGKAFSSTYSQNILTSVWFIVNTDVVCPCIVNSIGFEIFSDLWSYPIPLFTVFFIPFPPLKVFTIFPLDQFKISIKDFEGKLFWKWASINLGYCYTCIKFEAWITVDSKVMRITLEFRENCFGNQIVL